MISMRSRTPPLAVLVLLVFTSVSFLAWEASLAHHLIGRTWTHYSLSQDCFVGVGTPERLKFPRRLLTHAVL
jgi:hypothetical protein